MTEERSNGWTGGQRACGDFAPGLAHYTDKVLFDEPSAATVSLRPN
ncbi:hypothetical protein [Nocardia sp. AG03]|nr:hypothetical protein [Nocardia sp. AG03]